MEKFPEPKDIAIFIEVARQRSLSKAAIVLHLPISHVSRRLKNLETCLGLTLVERSTRHFKLTDFGETYAALCSEAFIQLNSAHAYIESMKGEPQGLLRVLCPFEFGLYLCKGFLNAYSQRYPKIQLDMILKNRATPQDYASFDVFIEVGQVLAPESFVQKKILGIRRRLFATPAFVDAHRFTSPRELLPRMMIEILNERGASPASDSVLFHQDTGEKIEVTAASPIRINSLTGMKKLALGGAGICFVAPFVVHDELKAGQLVPILSEWQSLPVELFVVFDAGKKANPRVKSLLHSLTEFLERSPLHSGEPV